MSRIVEPASAGDFRAEIARHQLRLYDLAPVVGVHPARLGAILREHVPLTPAIAARLREAIDVAVRGAEQV